MSLFKITTVRSYTINTNRQLKGMETKEVATRPANTTRTRTRGAPRQRRNSAGGMMGEVKLSEAELAELKDIFAMFDKDNSGSIDVNELESMVSSLGITATKEDLNDMIAEADIDKSGTIEFDEFKTLIGPHFQKEKPPEDYIDAFNFFDKDGDGFISRTELRTIMNTVDSKLAESDIEDMIKEADQNGDGKIDFDEFIKMMHQQ
ncbi:uncharacterized protein LOC134825124 isoform X2 [Bolinopsis microptera]|uniref:uncharacterized protein LOC134825124 isoform X2 n=1 Tax=Bolinopsis microptera TaxID=2820187 RepID=UPI00307A8E37